MDIWSDDLTQEQQFWIREKRSLDQLSEPSRRRSLRAGEPLTSHPLPQTPRLRKNEPRYRHGTSIRGGYRAAHPSHVDHELPSRNGSTLLLTEPVNFGNFAASKDSLTLRDSDFSDSESVKTEIQRI
ncbi:MAG: hypothetical protein M1820_000884 [Bogoriella megaspora]|nr:MAG: hypothetical protein M1820_000884 [Bogoriella megaspora]